MKGTRRVLRLGKGTIAAIVAGGAAWGALRIAGAAGATAAHAGGLLAAAGLAFSPRRGQAERVALATLAVVHLGVATAAPEDPTFLALLAAYAVLLCRALLELDRFRTRRGEREAPTPVGWKAQVGLTSTVLGVALLLFAVVPRPSEPVRILVGDRPPPPVAGSRGVARSGLGGGAPNLNGEGTVVLDSTPVASVRVLDGAGNPIHPRGPLRLRGRCYDSYREGTWTRGTTDVKRDGANGVVDLGPIARGGRERLDHEVRLEEVPGRTVLALPEVESIQAESIWTDGRGNLSFDREPAAGAGYRVVSWGLPSHPLGIDSVAIISPDTALVSVPEGLEFVAQVAARVAGADPSPWGKAKRIEEFLEAEFEYTTSPPEPRPGRDPIVDFLYRGSGYCVHFATAEALMLRTQGVPSRLASGYLVHEWDEAGRAFVVRRWDAHAWVEVPFPGIGWVAIDPSPVEGGPAPLAEAAAGAPARGAREAGRPGVFARVQGAMARFGGETQARAWGASGGWRWWPLAALAAAVVGALGWRRRRARMAASGAMAPKRGRAGGLYAEFVRRAARFGFRPSPDATPLEFAGRVEEALPGLDARRFVRLYYRARYGAKPLRGEETAAARGILEDLSSRRVSAPGRRGSAR